MSREEYISVELDGGLFVIAVNAHKHKAGCLLTGNTVTRFMDDKDDQYTGNNKEDQLLLCLEYVFNEQCVQYDLEIAVSFLLNFV